MLYFVYAIVMISFLDTFSQLPIIAPYGQQLGAGSFLIGLIVGMYSFTNIVGNIAAGQWVDRIGRKRVLLAGMIFAAASLWLYTLVQHPYQLLGVRFIHGIGGGLMLPALFAYLGDRGKRGQQGKTMALSGATVGFAAIAGPAFGGVVNASFGIEWVFYSLSVLFWITAIVVYVCLPESYRPLRTGKMNWQQWKALMKHPYLVIAYMAAFSLMFSQGILAYMLPLQIEEAGLSSAMTGMLLSTFGVTAILVFVLPTNTIWDRWGRIKPLFIGMACLSIALLLLSVVVDIRLLFAIMVLYGIGFAALFPAMSALIVDYSHQEQRGKAFGLFYAFFSLGVVVGPAFIGLWDVTPSDGFLMGAVMLIGMIIWIFFRLPKSKLIADEQDGRS